MSKEKVLLITDSITLPTGFGTNGKSIAWALAKKYDVHVLGLGYFSNQDMKVNINMENDERTVIQHPNYPRGSQHNDWGYKSIPYLLDKHKPSAMISVLDINMVEHIPKLLYPDTVKLKVMDLPAKKMVSQSALKMQLEGVMRKYKETYPRDVKWIQLAPVDGHPLMPKWKYTYQMADKTVAMSKYGRDVIKREFNMDVPFIWHGIDSSKFKATEKPDDCKDKFIIGDMNRNQQRKQPVRLLQAFAKFAKGKDDVYLHMQMDWNDKAGYPLMYWINMYGIGNKMVKPKPYGMSTDQVARTYNMWDVDVNPTAGEGFGLCLHPETEIITNNATKYIKDIKVGDKVLTKDGTFNKVKATTKRNVNEIYEVKVMGLPPIKCTKEHPFLSTLNSRSDIKNNNEVLEWKNVRQLNKGNFIATPIPKLKDGEIDEIYDLSKYDDDVIVDDDKVYYKYAYTNKRKWSYSKIASNISTTKKCIENTYKHIKNGTEMQSDEQIRINKFLQDNNILIPKQVKVNRYIKVDSDLLYLMGWYIAEGSSSNNMVDFSLSINELDIAKKLKRIVKRKFGIYSDIILRKDNNVCVLTISSKLISKFLRKECGHLAQNKHIPYDLMQYKSTIDILDSIFQGDGHNDTKRHNYFLTTVSKTLAWQCRNLLLGNHIKPNLNKPTIINDKQQQYTVGVSGEDYYVFTNTSSNKRTGSHAIISNGFMMLPINYIKKIEGLEKVFDLSVENVHSFVANGILAHNTTAESSFCGKPTIISDYTTSRELLMEGKPKPRGQLVKCDLEWEKLTQSACQRARIDIDDLVKAMNKYYHSRQMMKRHGKNAQIWAKNNLAMKDLQYKWQDLVKKTLNED